MSDVLYYNCDRPVEVLEANRIRASNVFTGVSFSSWPELGSHGPFKITFRYAAWVKLFTRVQYWVIKPKRFDRTSPEEFAVEGVTVRIPSGYYAQDSSGRNVTKAEYEALFENAQRDYGAWAGRVWKTSFMFRDEAEWFSPVEVRFSEEDVLQVTYMTNAPSLYPRIASKARRILRERYGPRYVERAVSDPYLHR